MLESRAKLDADAKKTEAVTIKLTDTSLLFVKTRSEQMGMESPPEYIRYLIDEDQKKASAEFNLLAKALGVKDSSGNVVS